MSNKSVSRLIIFAAIIVIAFLLWPYFTQVNLPQVNISSFGAGTARARVTQIIEDGDIDLGGTVQRYQIARVELLEGEYKGISMEMERGSRPEGERRCAYSLDINCGVNDFA